MISEVAEDMDHPKAVQPKKENYVEEDLLAAKLVVESAKPQQNEVVHQPKSSSELSYEVNEKVEEWIRYFSEKDHERFQRFLDRGEKYKHIVEATLEENGLPKDLFYLALIESGFGTHAHSHAGAVGIWQFIKPTAQRYGLRVDYYADERRDPRKATIAGAHYLKDLYTVFQNWYLAMAAYNSGEMRVLGAIMRKNTRDFWELVDEKALPKETMNYIPKFIAATIIGNHPERFGFTRTSNDELHDVETVKVPNRVRLADIAKQINFSNKKLKSLNPHLNRSITPSGKDGYFINVPKEYVKTTEKNYIALSKKQVRRPLYVAEQPSVYRVKGGDSLGRIARRFGVTVSYLKKINGLRSSTIYPGKRLKVSTGGTSYGRHRIRRGETLGTIAAKYGTSIRKLKKINRMRRSTIIAGRVIKIPTSGKATYRRHRVRRGESLFRIAKKYGVSIAQLKRLNNLRRNRIYTGQVLKVKM